MQIAALAHANEMHPVPPPANNVEPPIPDIALPQYTVILQPLVVTVTPSPLRPAEPAADTAMLVRVARVAPEWEFSGHVDAPQFAVDMQRALGQKVSAPQPQPIHASQPAKKKRGFWGSIKRHLRRQRRDPPVISARVVKEKAGPSSAESAASGRDDRPIDFLMDLEFYIPS